MRLLRSTVVVSGMTLISRIMGFVRDMVFARMFGASAAMDAFLVAFRIPNFMRRLFAEGSFSLAFVPVLAEVKEKGTPQELKELVDAVAGTLLGVLLLVVVVGVAGAWWLVSLFAPGFLDSPAQHALTTELLRITFPYLLLISLTALSGGILNSFNRFAVPAITPVLLNVSFLAAAFGLAPHLDEPVAALAWAVLLAGFLQLGFQIPALMRIGMLPRPRWGWRHSGVRKILRLMIPTLFGSSVAQINLLFDTLVASFLLTGSVTWLYNSDRLMEFPLGLIGVALGTVILPHLSRKHSATDGEGFARALDWALRVALLVGLPAGLGLILCAGPLLSTLYEYGRYSAFDVSMASLSLALLSLGLPAFATIKVLAPGYYARQDTRTPVRAGIIAMLANMLFSAVFLGALLIWQNTRGVSFGEALATPGAHACLALASGLAGYLNAWLLWRGLRRAKVFQAQPGWAALGLRLLAALAAMALSVLALLSLWPDWSSLDGGGRAWRLLLVVGAGGLSYVGVLAVSGMRVRHLGPGH